MLDSLPGTGRGTVSTPVPRVEGLTARFVDGVAAVPPGFAVPDTDGLEVDGLEVPEPELDEDPEEEPLDPDEPPLCAMAAAERRTAPAMVVT